VIVALSTELLIVLSQIKTPDLTEFLIHFDDPTVGQWIDLIEKVRHGRLRHSQSSAF
jgi:hypothetical protein